MKMKKQKVVCLLLVFTMIVGCFGGVTLNSTESKAASIYFAGKYTCTNIKEKFYKGKTVTLKMYGVSMPGEKDAGDFKIIVSVPHASRVVKGRLYKVGKNKYRYRKGKVTLIFKVYNKKVVIKQNRTSWSSVDVNYSGTYTQKKIYH
jgi:hypothetical protein